MACSYVDLTVLLAKQVHLSFRTEFHFLNLEQTAYVQGGPQKLAPFLYALTLPVINRFSKLFHYQNQQKICNSAITKDPTTPRVSLHYLVKCQVS